MELNIEYNIIYIINKANVFETDFLFVYNCKFISLRVYRMRIELNSLPG